MKPHLAIVGSMLLALPSGASEIEQLRELTRQQAATIHSLEQEIRQLKGAGSVKTQSQPAAEAGVAAYRIRPGDTLSSIAKAQGTSVAKLLKANPGINPNRLKLGQAIQLPPPPVPEPVPATQASAPVPASAEVVPPPVSKPTPVVTPSPEAAASPAPVAPVAATTEPGRSGIVRVMIEEVTTAGEFAARHQSTLERINQLNGLDLTEASTLAKGSELLCPKP